MTPYQYASNNPIMNIDLDGLEGTQSIDNENRTITFSATINYVPKSRNLSRAERKQSYSAGQVRNLERKLNREFRKKGVPQAVDFVATGRNGEIRAAEPFDIHFEVNFVLHQTYAEAEAAADISDRDLANENILLSKFEPISTTIPNPEFNSRLPVSESNQRQFRHIIVGRSTFRRLRLTSTRGHTAAHELFHDLIHHNSNNPNSTNQAYLGRINTFEGHQTEGGIFVRKNARTKTKIQNINGTNIRALINILPIIQGRVPLFNRLDFEDP